MTLRNLSRAALSVYLSRPVQSIVRGLMILGRREQRFAGRYLAEHEFRGLQIGAGSNRHPGWLHTNWYPIRPWARKSMFLDATDRFPFDDATFDCIFSEHMIEHVPYSGGAKMLSECFRVLKPGGVLRVSTPDLRAIVRLLSDGLTSSEMEWRAWANANYVFSQDPKTAVSIVNAMVRRWGHQFIYDEETLSAALQSAGFQEMRRYRVGESQTSAMVGIDHASRMPAGLLDAESVIVEGLKPLD